MRPFGRPAFGRPLSPRSWFVSFWLVAALPPARGQTPPARRPVGGSWGGHTHPSPSVDVSLSLPNPQPQPPPTPSATMVKLGKANAAKKPQAAVTCEQSGDFTFHVPITVETKAWVACPP